MHDAMIVKLVDITPIDGADFIVSAGVHNGAVVVARVVVHKKHTEGELGIYFQPDLQLSEEYCTANDLIARYDENGKKIGGGYFDHRRRVVAQRFKKVKSDGLWMPLESLTYINNGRAHIPSKIGDLFNEVVAHDAVIHPICTKYIPVGTKVARGNNIAQSLDRFVLDFPEHKDTEQLIHRIGEIPTGATIYLQEKMHGTSFRKGNVLVKKDLTKWQRVVNYIARVIGKKPYTTEAYDIVHGTRRVVIHAGKIGFHGSEDFRYAATASGNLLPEEIIYGEIVGYANGSPIMNPHDTKDLKDVRKEFGDKIIYHYGCGDGECKAYVYNIKHKVNGAWVSLPYKDMAQRAHGLGLLFIPALRMFTYDGNAESLLEQVKSVAEPNGSYAKSTYADHISEGVIIRVEHQGLVTFYKYKSFAFKVMEGIATINVSDVEDTM